MARERIVVLYNTDYDAEQAANANLPDATSVRGSAKAIASALIEGGYSVELRGVHGVDVYAVLAKLAADKPDLLFNLCESMDADPQNEPTFAGLLDLFKIPYTGANLLALASCLYKHRTKDILLANGVPTPAYRFIRRTVESWGANPNIELLGNLDAERLSIVSFVVRRGPRYLHHNFVVALLNDLFGIQARGGCSCAGPYGHRLPGIDLDRSHSFEREITRGCEGIKPGWVRVNFNYFISEVVFSYILEAVHLVADQGWKLLGDYRFDPATALWRHRMGPVEPPLRLDRLGYDDQGRLRVEGVPHATASDGELAGYLDQARRLLAARTSDGDGDGDGGGSLVGLSADFEALRWFVLPAACLASSAGSTGRPNR